MLLSSLPFVASTTGDARRLLKLAEAEYEKIFSKGKQKLLYVSPWPASGIWARKPLNAPDDLKNLKIRTFDPVGTAVFKGVGAGPIQMAWGDVVPALATNAIDAVLTSADGGVSVKMWEYTRVFNDINYAVPLNFVHVNAAAFAALPPDVQEIVKEAAKEAQERNWARIESRVAENFATIEKAKGQIMPASAALLASLRGAATPTIEDWQKKTSGRGQAILDQFRAGK
jgi:TRAP-type C4-dicarboxylate transport system substrate-binding protein